MEAVVMVAEDMAAATAVVCTVAACMAVCTAVCTAAVCVVVDIMAATADGMAATADIADGMVATAGMADMEIGTITTIGAITDPITTTVTITHFTHSTAQFILMTATLITTHTQAIQALISIQAHPTTILTTIIPILHTMIITIQTAANRLEPIITTIDSSYQIVLNCLKIAVLKRGFKTAFSLHKINNKHT